MQVILSLFCFQRGLEKHIVSFATGAESHISSSSPDFNEKNKKGENHAYQKTIRTGHTDQSGDSGQSLPRYADNCCLWQHLSYAEEAALFG